MLRMSLVSLGLSFSLMVVASPHAYASLTVSPSSNTGDFTISWSEVPNTNDGYRILESTDGGASWSSTYTAYGTSRSFSGKTAGVYTYKLRSCSLVLRWGEWLPQCVDSGYGYATANVSDPALPQAATYHEQLQYRYELRSGDFDNNGHTDVLVDRLTAGAVDGSMQTSIIYGSASGVTVSVPTPSQLTHARTFAVNNDLAVSGSDENIDGYADVLLMGLANLNGVAFTDDCLILFASGQSGVAAPLALRFIDQEYMEFFENISSALVDPQFFADNVQVTLRPDYDFIYDCEWAQAVISGWDLLDCRWRLAIVAWIPQVSGVGYHASAPAAVDAINDVIADDRTNGDPLIELSDAFEVVLGVPSFGYKADGSRTPTNYSGDDVSDLDERDQLIEVVMMRQYGIYAHQMGNEDFDEAFVESWPRHKYHTSSDSEVGNQICKMNTDTDVIVGGGFGGPFEAPLPKKTIPAAACTRENVFCWARRRPANVADITDIEITESGDESVLFGNNPIQTHVFPGEYTLVNETLGDVSISGVDYSGHILHDPLQDTDCADHSTPEAIVQNSPRCAFVVRQVIEEGEGINITTNGEGNNTPDMVVFNNIAGAIIFDRVDGWIMRQMAEAGATLCEDID